MRTSVLCLVLLTETPLMHGYCKKLLSSHQEAHALLILHSGYVDQTTHSSDTDNFFYYHHPFTRYWRVSAAHCLLPKIHSAFIIISDTGTENERKMIKIQTLCQKIDKDVQDAILGLHAFTGCGVNNAFVQKGKSCDGHRLSFINYWKCFPPLLAWNNRKKKPRITRKIIQ